EDGAEINEEAFGPLAGEDLATAGKGMNRCAHEIGVVRCGQRTDVARRRGQSFAQRLLLAALPVDAHDGEELPTIPILVRQGEDRTRVVQEGVRVRHVVRERELVDDLGLSVAVVVYVDLIEHIVTELVEVRATGRTLE